MTEKFDKHRKEAFLKLLRKGTRRSAACKKVGISRMTLKHHLDKYPRFRIQMDEAEMDANELIEDSLFNAAINGNVTAQQVWLYNRAPSVWRDQRNFKSVSNILTLKEKLTAVLTKIEAADNLETAMLGVKEAKEYMDQLATFGQSADNTSINNKIEQNVTIIDNPQWIELRTCILEVLEQYPEARKALVAAIS